MSPSRLVVVAAIAVALVGCDAGAAGTLAPDPTGVLATPAASVAGRDAPPEALLATEGGDPVAGQLGTYSWLDSGSDAPWLAGAPIVVGAGEPLAVRLEPAVDIAEWDARAVPAGADGPAGAVPLAGGSGVPAFAAPLRGAWTVEVRIDFGRDVGAASYAWLMTVE